MPEAETDTLLARLEEIVVDDAATTIDHVLDFAREALGMEVGFYSEFADGEQVVRAVRGEREPLGLEEGTSAPLEDTYCRRMVAGLMPNVIADAQRDEHTRELPATRAAGIGSYIGVPVRLSSGRIYGTFCCASSEASSRVHDRHVPLMRLLARLLADQLERENLEHANVRLREAVQAERARSAPRADSAPGPEATSTDLMATLSLWFAAAANAAGAARRALDALAEHLEQRQLHEVSLLVTELVTNSVRHAGIGPTSSVGLDVSLSPTRLRVEVSDPGPGFEPPAAPGPHPERIGGWGLQLVDRLSDRWGVLRGAETRVWFEMDEVAEPAATAGAERPAA